MGVKNPHLGNTVSGILDQLENGAINIDDAVERFNYVKWPELRPKHGSIEDLEFDRDEEFEPNGGFGLVSQAFTDGRITSEQYAALAKACSDCTCKKG